MSIRSWSNHPVQETRKYVQRVFGNYMVYRARLVTRRRPEQVMHSIN
jgi:hypothetical protein